MTDKPGAPLVVRVDAGTKNRVVFAARADGVPVTVWIRRLIDAELRTRMRQAVRDRAAEQIPH